MLILKLAFKNILGQGFRSWLNFFILSLVFVGIIAMQGFYVGWEEQSRRSMTDWEIGKGQYWVDQYDVFDPFTYDKSHSVIPADLQMLIDIDKAVPMLLAPAVVYPDGRFRNTVVKGIPINQTVLKFPSQSLKPQGDYIPAMIGNTTARSMKLEIGDVLTMRWRDVNGTFDARDVKIVETFQSSVPTVDANCFWVGFEQLQEMLGTPGEASIITLTDESFKADFKGWTHKDLDFLFADFNAIMATEMVGAVVMYLIFILLAMIAIFDTQMLAIFKRRKEIGTLMALGMTRKKIIRLFVSEGAVYALGSIFVGLIWGIPILMLTTHNGWNLAGYEDMGMVGMEGIMYPVYPLWLYTLTAVIILVTTAFVSWIPAKKISKLKPTEALSGRVN
ncbi:MAG: FtsX-like permease family protein [Candidatus Zophobacter franzmannii]|jgi:ABC-type lipoprotein release transport system permease subunit|nr:FtsX-like permease family protein [Candidatus Zophobacter franzmannii]